MTIEEAFGVNEEQLEEIRSFATFMKRVKRFSNNSTIETFKEMFGDEAERLITHYRSEKVNQDFIKFLTYLTQPQINIIYTYIIKNYTI